MAEEHTVTSGVPDDPAPTLPGIGPGHTPEDARTLWRAAVTIEAPADLTIPSAPGSRSLSAAVTMSPRPRHLSKQGDAESDRDGIDFELGALLGQGGMGVVYTARQASLDRQIAVKMLNATASRDEEAVEKFLAEAVVTGNLDHPNIVPVYDMGGTDDGSLFYAMKEVSGAAWSTSIAELSLGDNLRILLSVCDAVAFAHSRGVLHRDLKPENVMLGAYGETLLVDWGLAVTLNDDQTLTDVAGMGGTPAYMAPEMATCDFAEFGVTTDVYLLGGMLFEIVTGLKPHTGENVYATISAAMENVIPPTDQQGELLDVALQAMTTEPADRYPTVKALQVAIRHYQQHAESLKITRSCAERYTQLHMIAELDLYREVTEIIAGFQQAIELWPENANAIDELCRARIGFAGTALGRGDIQLAQSQVNALKTGGARYGVQAPYAASMAELEQSIQAALLQAASRARLIRVSVGVAIVGALATVVITSAAYLLTRKERDRARAARRQELVQREQTEGALEAARASSYFNQVVLAENYIQRAAPDHARALLEQAPVHLRGWEWGLLAGLSHRALLSVRHPLGLQDLAAFSPDGRQLVTVGLDGGLTLWNGLTATPLKTLRSGLEGIAAVAFLPGARDIRLVTRSGDVRTWSLAEAEEYRFLRLEQFPGDMLALTTSADGALVAGLQRGARLLIWNAERATLEATSVLRPPPPDVNAVAITPDGRALAVGSTDGIPRVYDCQTGQLREALTPTPMLPATTALAFSPDGTHLAAGTGSRILSVWHIATRRELMRLGEHEDALRAVAFDGSGRRLVSLSGDESLRIWDARHFSTFLDLESPSGAPVHAVAYAPSGDTLAMGGAAGSIAILDTRDWQARLLLTNHTDTVTSLEYSTDGSKLLSAGHDGSARIWDPENGQSLQSLDGHDGPITAACFAIDGTRVLTTDRRATRLWRTDTGACVATLPAEAGNVTTGAFSPDGRLMLTAGDQLVVWDAHTGKVLAGPVSLPSPATCAAFSRDGQLILTGDREAVRLRDAATAEEIATLAGHVSAVSCVAFSPDGRRAVSGGLYGGKVWDISKGRELVNLRQHAGWMTSLAFSPDGRQLVTGSSDGRARVWLSLPGDLSVDAARQWQQQRYAAWRRHAGLE